VEDGAILGKFPHLFHSDAFDLISESSLHSEQARLSPDILPPCSMCPDTASDYLSSLALDPLTLMDIFCGAGGMSQGFTRTGVATAICGVDVSRSCCETYQ
jgi:2-polyprenyl-3-methyl-5-hydroxy-6-metoxy-1,4-benzoquinol methylase